MRLSIIVPVYNEKNTLREIIRRLRDAPLEVEKEVIAVDDGSTDGSREILKELEQQEGLIILYHQANLGKGYAIRTGLARATGEAVVIQDADLEYDPRDIKKLLGPYIEGRGKVVYGSRFTGERRNMFFWHYLGNRFLSLLVNILYNTTLSDMETGYKFFNREVLKNIPLRIDGFGFEPEVTAKVLRRGYRIYEVPISYMGREYSEGKKITWIEGPRAIFLLFWFLLFN